jgi:predicted RNA polymerase sigma factor
VTVSETHLAINAVFRIESPRLDRGADAHAARRRSRGGAGAGRLLAALEEWPSSGVPDKPGAWLMATAKHRAINQLRHGKMRERKHAELGSDAQARQNADVQSELVARDR